MEIHRELETILSQINKELPQADRVSPEDITKVGHELNDMLTTATQQAGHQFTPGPVRTLREKLVALWESIKAKINDWIYPISPQWNRFLKALKAKLQQLQSTPGNEKWIAIGMLAIGVALFAVLVKSIPLIIGLLAILGFTSLLRLTERVTRLPQYV